jgi:hypothetical protein
VAATLADDPRLVTVTGGLDAPTIMAVKPAARPARRSWRPGAAAWALWALAIAAVATLPWFDRLLRDAGRGDLTQLDASTSPFVAANPGVPLAPPVARRARRHLPRGTAPLNPSPRHRRARAVARRDQA